MSAKLTDQERALAEKDMAFLDAAYDAAEDQSWRSLILAGYLPYWSWRSRRFRWRLADVQLDE